MKTFACKAFIVWFILWFQKEGHDSSLLLLFSSLYAWVPPFFNLYFIEEYPTNSSHHSLLFIPFSIIFFVMSFCFGYFFSRQSEQSTFSFLIFMCGYLPPWSFSCHNIGPNILLIINCNFPLLHVLFSAWLSQLVPLALWFLCLEWDSQSLVVFSGNHASIIILVFSDMYQPRKLFLYQKNDFVIIFHSFSGYVIEVGMQ